MIMDIHKDNQNIDLQVLNDLKKMMEISDKEEEKQLLANLCQAKENFLESKKPEDIAKVAIIHDILENNPFHSQRNNIKIRQLSNELINCFQDKDLIEISLKKLNEKFVDSSPFKVMISFPKCFNPEKKHLELYFKLMMVNQDIMAIILGINKLLNIKNQLIENQLKKLNFQNPYSILFIRDLLYELIMEENNLDKELILKNTIENMKKYYIFHCPKCLGILYTSTLNKVILTCVNQDFTIYPENINDLKSITNFILKCKKCQHKIELFETNYKCLECKELFCELCADSHKKESFNNILINIYDLGYICEEHCKKYTSFCGKCKINLCKKCQENHYHKINKNMYQINLKKIESIIKKENDVSSINDYISMNLASVYKFMENFSYTNIFIKLSIWFMEIEKRKDIEKDKFKFYFDEFFDDNFKKYYSKLIENALEGKVEAYNHLLLIKENYEKQNIKANKSFSSFELKFHEENLKRNKDISNWASKLSKVFYYLDGNKLEGELCIIKLKTKTKKLSSDISILKSKILSLFNTYKSHTSYLLKILNRYLSDSLLRKIIQK